MSTQKEYLIADGDLSNTRRYTSIAPSAYEWYLASRHAIWLNQTESEEARRVMLRTYRCDWGFTYQSVTDTVFANKWPYSYKTLSDEAIERMLHDSM